MPALYKITEEQVLASAGLDAFVVSLYSHHTLLSPCTTTVVS